MQVIYIEREMLDIFEPLIARSAFERIKTEESSIALGLINEDDEAIGALTGVLFEDTFYITSIFVAPEYRGDGGGTLLIDTLMEGLEGEEIIVCVEFMTDDIYSDGLASFFEAIEFMADDDEPGVYSAELDDIGKNSIFKESGYVKCENDIHSFTEIPHRTLEKLNEFATDNFLPLPQDGLFSDSVDAETSVAHIDEQGIIDAYLVIDNSIEYMPTVAGLYNEGDSKILGGLLRRAMELLRLKYPMGVELAFTPVNGDSMGILQKLAPDATKLSYKYYTFPKA